MSFSKNKWTFLLSIFLQIISQNSMAEDSVGTINGNIEVSETGAAIYNVPIEIFKSGTGFDPQIGIVYNSQQTGYGNVGYGMNISGISSITRTGKDLFHDGVVRKVRYEVGDNYVLDGKRLYLKTGTQGMDGSTYTVEGNPYATVTLHGNDYKSNESIWFEFIDADGNEYQYERCLRSYFGHPNRMLQNIAWYITQAKNRYNDKINYTYIEENNVIYPSSIEYGRTGERHTITFSYINLSSPRSYKLEGGSTAYISKRLSYIEAKCQSDIYRKYSFIYDTTSDGSIRKSDRLETIKVYNADNDSLSPLNFNWNHLQAATINRTTNNVVTQVYHYGEADEGNSIFLSADVNNDGISDIIRLWKGNVYNIFGYSRKSYLYVSKSDIDSIGNITFELPMQYEIPIDFEIEAFGKNIGSMSEGSYICNIDGNEYNDIIIPYLESSNGDKYCRYHIIRNCGANTQNQSKPITYQLSPNAQDIPLFGTFDMNSDGKDEIIYIEQKKNNNSFKGGIISNIEFEPDTLLNVNIGLTYSQNKDIERMFIADCNADGLKDLILLFTNGYKVYFNNGGNNLSSMFTESNSKEITNSTSLKDFWRIAQGDFNGDGLIDFVVNTKGEAKLGFLFNKGDGTFTVSTKLNVDFADQTDSSKDDHYFAIRVADFDKDGLSDVFVSKKELSHHSGWLGIEDYYEMEKTQVRWYRSDGTKPELWLSYDKGDNERDCSENFIFSGDFNGDGYIELANYGSALNQEPNNDFTENNIYIYSFPTNISLGRISRIANGYGKTISISYACGTNPSVYSKGEFSIASFPILTLVQPIALVSRLINDKGTGRTETNIYSYEGLKYHVQGRDLIGFSSIKVNNLTLGTIDETKITEWNQQLWIPNSISYTTKIGNDTSTTNSTFLVYNDSSLNGNFFSYCSESMSTDYDGNITRHSCIYDLNRGVPLEECTYYGIGTNMYKKKLYTWDTPICGKYLPATVSAIQKHSDDSNIYRVVNSYTYDAKGDIISDVMTSEYLGSIVSTTTQYTRDSYGNILTKNTIGENVNNATECKEYDSLGLRTIRQYTIPASIETAYNYDICGNITTLEDRSNPSNFLSTYYEYDGWGRLIHTLYPDGTEENTEISYDNGFQGGLSVYKTVKNTTGKAPITTYYDCENKEISSATIGEGNISISTTTIYNKFDKIADKSQNEGRLTINTSYDYDTFGRVISETCSNGRAITYTYDNRRKVTHLPTNTISKDYDAWGNIVEITDSACTTTYSYNSIGMPSVISTDSNSININYDGAGRRSTFSDPDAGTQTYTYAADGRLLSETNGRGIETAFTYDAFGRVTEKDCDGLIQTNIYGTEGYGKNRIIRKEHEGLNIDYTYDALGRITSETRSIESNNNSASTSYTVSYEYDNIGKLFKKYYPGGLTITYQYDSLGYNTGIIANGISIYNLLSFNGEETVSSFCNSITTKSAIGYAGYPRYDRIQQGADIFDEVGYFYNERTANLMSRYRSHSNQNSIDGSDENIEAPGDEDVSMPLRSMNRMDIGDDEGLEENDGMVVTNETFRYDNLDRLTQIFNSQNDTIVISYSSNGNIKFKSGLGNYYYNANSKPHAVSSIDNTDGIIGNATHQYSYHPNGKIESIHDDASGRTMSFMYGPDDEKWETVLEDSTDIQRTVFYFDNYEKVCENNCTREYYFLENNVIAIKENGQFSFYKAFVDNLGNILSVYTSNGSLVFEAEYDAWGKQTVSVNTVGLRYGYTGHEMLPEFDIINMEGRLYDPIIGRFLSCDNYVQEPDNPQNFNRYSYCLNNPLKYTDPSGEVFGFIGGFFRGLGDFFSGDILAPITETFKGLNNDLKLLGGWFIGDFGQVISRFTLELPQSIIGYLYSDISQVFRDIDGIYYYDGATFVIDKHSYGAGKGVSLGSFINIETNEDIPKDSEGRFAPYLSNLYMHEYGHYLQSQEYSWGYLFSVGIPSGLNLLWGDGKEDSSIRGVKKHNLKWYEMKADTKAHEYFSGKN